MMWLPAVFYGERVTGASRLGNDVCEPVVLCETSVRASMWGESESGDAGNRLTETDRTFKTHAPLSDMRNATEADIGSQRYAILSVREASPRWRIVRARAVKRK